MNKEDTKSSVAIFNPEMIEGVAEATQIAIDLNERLEKGTFQCGPTLKTGCIRVLDI
jgi:hypothetical protein